MSHGYDVYPRNSEQEGGTSVPPDRLGNIGEFQVPTQHTPEDVIGSRTPLPEQEKTSERINWRTKLSLLLAGVILAGGGAGGLYAIEKSKGSAPSPNEGGRPAATSTPFPTSHEAAPTAPKEDLSKNVTAETYGFEFIGDADVSGKYVGDTAAIKALTVQGEYTPIQSIDKLIDRFNIELNYGTDPSLQAKEDQRRYETADEEQTGIGAIAKDFVYPVIREALTDPKVAVEQGTSLDDFLSHIEELNYNNIGNAATVINVNSSPPFASKLQIKNETLQASLSDGKGHIISQISGELVFDDNINDPSGVNQLSQNRAKPGGFNKVTTPQYHEQYHVTLTESTDENHVTKLIGGRFDDVSN